MRAAIEFALPQIRIVRPELVVCLGLKTFHALRVAYGFQKTRTIVDAIDRPFDYEGSRVWCQAHTGWLGQANRNKGGIDRVSEDWERMQRDVTVKFKEVR